MGSVIQGKYRESSSVKLRGNTGNRKDELRVYKQVYKREGNILFEEFLPLVQSGINGGVSNHYYQ